MSYLALARKWRPRNFTQLLGQDHINKALIKSLDQQRLHHAYLFTGTRGVGKTSIARLMAKALNCEEGITANPCLACSACLSIEEGRFVDLIEIDGASKTRVEDTRELLENIAYAPSSGRFKIYLIDEVHMLSQHSFNALLKTLEEPPSHVKFLLATTDPQKLPITVLSRCLQFNLRHLSIEVIIKQLTIILEEEKLAFEPLSLQLLAKAANGSMRDALSLLDQAIASSDTLKLAEIKSILGYSQQDYALQLLQALAQQNAAQIILISRQIAEEGGFFYYVLNEILSYLHQITIYSYLPTDDFIVYSGELKEIAGQLPKEDIQLFYQIGLKGIEELEIAPVPSIGFEMIILRMLTFKPLSSSYIPPLAHETGTPKVSSTTPEESKAIHVEFFSADKPYESGENEHKEILSNTTDEVTPPKHPVDNPPDELNWTSIIRQLNLTGLASTAAENAELIKKDDNELILSVSKGHQSLFTPNIKLRIEQALTGYFRQNIKICLQTADATIASPAQQKQEQIRVNIEDAESSLKEDLFFQKLKQEFSGEIVKNSIEPY